MSEEPQKPGNPLSLPGKMAWIVICVGLVVGFGVGYAQSALTRTPEPWTAGITATPPAIIALPTPTGISLDERVGQIATESAKEEAAIPGVGKPAPDFALQTIQGEQVSLSDFQGKPVLINFWASWCEPCKTEMPLLQAAYDQYAPEALVVLGVNDTRNDSPEAASQFATDLGLSFPILIDADYQITFPTYRVIQLPMSFFVDGSGMIQAVSIGQLSEEQLTAGIEKILPTPSE